MRVELDPGDVTRRLEELRSLYVAESVDAARTRLAAERPLVGEPFDQAVARSLAELRALCELANYLHHPG